MAPHTAQLFNMAPHVPSSKVTSDSIDQQEQDVDADLSIHCHHGKHEDWKMDINLKNIYHDLKHLDWSKVVWANLALYLIFHIFSIYALLLVVSLQVNWKTLVWAYVLYFHSMIGTTMGAHRLWSHKSFKARRPLRIWLMICQTMSLQTSIHEWARDHRVHHKFTETDADPYNSQRGFFFCHMGWVMYRKHPKVIEQGKKLNMSDLESDSVVMWQKRNYIWMAIFWCFVVPTLVPMYFWDESWVSALMVSGFLRYIISVQFTWCVNSLAHLMGSKPFDKDIFPSQNGLVSMFTMGEGWHNYHHVFPWDYRASELGGWLGPILSANFTTIVIDLMAFTGLVYDRKTVPHEMWFKRTLRTGDGSYIGNYEIKTK